MLALEQIDFSDLSSIPELAFIEFEKRLRKAIGTMNVSAGTRTSSEFENQRLYVSAIISFMQVYEIKGLDVIDISEAGGTVFKSKFGLFVNRVNAFKIRCSLQHTKDNANRAGTPINLSVDFRGAIGRQLEIIRKIVRQEITDVNKRDAIFSKIAALQKEIETQRTTIDQFFSRMIDLSLVVKECGENISPLLNKIQTIMTLASERPEDIIRLALEDRVSEEIEKRTERPAKEGRRSLRFLRRA